jgi:hypothetical protein
MNNGRKIVGGLEALAGEEVPRLPAKASSPALFFPYPLPAKASMPLS